MRSRSPDCTSCLGPLVAGLVIYLAAVAAPANADFEWTGDFRLRADLLDFPEGDGPGEPGPGPESPGPGPSEPGPGPGSGPGPGPEGPSVDSVDRYAASLRAGFVWGPSSWVETGAGFRWNVGSGDEFPPHDNEPRDEFELDRLFLRWLPSANDELTVGKTDLPLDLSPMLWDDDLRPIGVALTGRRPVGAFDEFEWSLGYFEPDHPFGGDEAMVAGQIAYVARQGALTGGSVRLAYLDFDDLETLPPALSGRGNPYTMEGPESEYQIADLQAALRVPLGGGALKLSVDVAENLEADVDEQAFRGGFRWRSAEGDGRLALGGSYEDIAAQAVLGAYNSDDWWFHAAFRGTSVWLSYELRGGAVLKLSGFEERLDGTRDDVRRLLIDLTWGDSRP